jgi:hypothetical protein
MFWREIEIGEELEGMWYLNVHTGADRLYRARTFLVPLLELARY